MKKNYKIIGIIFLFLLIITNFVSLKYVSWGKMGMILWFFSYLYFFIYWARCLVNLITNSIKNKTFFSLITIIILLLSLFINIPKQLSFGRETSQETACVLRLLKDSPDWGFNQTCLFGYPAREFLLSALPSLFGRNLVLLNLGGSLFFFLGLIIFSSGVLKYFNYHKYGDILNAIFLSSFYHIYFFNHFQFYYEHSIFLFCFSLILVGLYFHWKNDQDGFDYSLFGILFFYLIYSYTPSLSLLAFVIPVIIYYLFQIKNRKNVILIAFLTLSIILSLISSFNFRRDLNITNTQEKPINELIIDIRNSFKHILFQTERQPFFSPLFTFVFVSAVTSSLFFVFGKGNAYVSCWIVLTIIISVVSKGYAYYGIDFRLQRATLIFPVFYGTLITILEKLNFKAKKLYKILIILYLLVLTSGLYYHIDFLSQRTKDVLDDFQVINQIKTIVSEKQHLEKIYIVGNTDGKFLPLNDSLQYFFPDIKSEIFPEFNCVIPQNTLLVVFKSHYCYDLLMSQQLSHTFGVKTTNTKTQNLTDEALLDYEFFYNIDGKQI